MRMCIIRVNVCVECDFERKKMIIFVLFFTDEMCLSITMIAENYEINCVCLVNIFGLVILFLEFSGHCGLVFMQVFNFGISNL